MAGVVGGDAWFADASCGLSHGKITSVGGGGWATVEMDDGAIIKTQGSIASSPEVAVEHWLYEFVLRLYSNGIPSDRVMDEVRLLVKFVTVTGASQAVGRETLRRIKRQMRDLSRSLEKVV